VTGISGAGFPQRLGVDFVFSLRIENESNNAVRGYTGPGEGTLYWITVTYDGAELRLLEDTLETATTAARAPRPAARRTTYAPTGRFARSSRPATTTEQKYDHFDTM
jgi:hypothetical protein